jgi:hypothetical protein
LQLPFGIFEVEADIQDYTYPKDFLFFFTVFLVVALMLLVVIATLNYNKESKYLKCFSLQQSFKALEIREGSELNVFNGIRSLAMTWVVLGHTYLNTAGGGVINVFNLP